jgi:hypothetical protein
MTIQSVERQIDATGRRFDLTIKNATGFTNKLVDDLKAPVTDIRDGVNSANALLSSVQQDARIGASAISANVSSVAAKLVGQFRTASRLIQANPGFAALAQDVTLAYNSAQGSIREAQMKADSRVADFELNLGSTDKAIGGITGQLTEMIDVQKKDFDVQTKLATNEIQDKVGSISSQLRDAAEANSARLDEVQANTDSQMAETLDNVMAKIGGSQTNAKKYLSAVDEKILASQADGQRLIQTSFASALSDSASVLAKSQDLAAQVGQTSDQLGNLTRFINIQSKEMNQNVQSASNQIGSLRAIGASAVDGFYSAAIANTTDVVSGFSSRASSEVEKFAASIQAKIDGLEANQKNLTAIQSNNDRDNSVVQANLKADLARAKSLLSQIKTNSTLSNSDISSLVNQMLSEFKSGSNAEILGLKKIVQDGLKGVEKDLGAAVDGAGNQISNQTSAYVPTDCKCE